MKPVLLAGLLQSLLLGFSLPAGAVEPPKPAQLVLREWAGTWGDAMIQEVLPLFTQRTGIPVVIDRRVDAQMSKIVMTALAQHRQPPVDLFMTLDTSAYQDVKRGMMENLSPDEIPNLKNMLPIAKPEMDAGSWPYVNFGADVNTLVYRTNKFPNGPPTSLAVLFDPAFKGRVLYSSTATGAIGVVALLNGWKVPDDFDKIWAFIESRFRPMSPILGGDTQVVQALERDEIDLAFTYPGNVHVLTSGGVAWTKAKEGMMGIPEAIWVPRGLPESNRYWAMRFIDILLSEDVLKAYCGKLVIRCFRKNMPVPEAAKDDPAYPLTDEDLAKIYEIPLDLYTAHHSEWDARYDEIVK